MKEIYNILPVKIINEVKKYSNNIEEIRIRKCLTLRINTSLVNFENIKTSHEDIQDILQKATDYSLHSYIEQLKNGFITLKGGHRLGICGEAYVSHDKILNFKQISSINIRVSKVVKSFGFSFLNEICGHNVLIISPPNYGKTTLLKQVCTHLSNNHYNISVIDERCEMRGDLGVNVDILSGVVKENAVLMMLKTMSPDYIILDEITNQTDILSKISNAGVKIVATIHANNINDIESKGILKYFDSVIEINIENGTRKYIKKEVMHHV